MVSEPLPLWSVVTPVVALVALAVLCWLRPFPLLRIVLLCSFALIGYACIQDQISVRLCPEYFTLAHPALPAPFDRTYPPTLLALVWGFLAGLPGGIALGIPVALASSLGPFPKLSAQNLRRPILFVLLFAAAVTLITVGSSLYNAGIIGITIADPWKSAIPPGRHIAFFVVACAHFGTYTSILVAGLGLCLWIVRHRIQLQNQN